MGPFGVTVFLMVAGLLSLALRRRTAAVRHLVWTSALAGALAIPFVSGALPHWTIPVWTDMVPAPGVVASSTLLSAAAVSQATTRDWNSAVFVIWGMGALAVLLQTFLGAVAVMRLKRRARPAQPEVASLARELGPEMGLGTEVRVLTTEDATTPMTWGVFRPVVLLPAVVAGGDPERLRAVLLHELAVWGLDLRDPRVFRRRVFGLPALDSDRLRRCRTEQPVHGRGIRPPETGFRPWPQPPSGAWTTRDRSASRGAKHCPG
jgi:beta-lactamase regulating signal transducer with metallopeptidase domain